MKKVTPKVYIYSAAAIVVIIALLLFYFFFTAFSKKSSTEYVYIDNDDTLDSVIVKLQPLGKEHSMTGMSTLMRHWGYNNDKIRTGRYAVETGVNTFTLFRHLKNGLQSPLRLTVPEARTTERLAAILSKKLMIDSTEIAEHLADQAYCSKYGYDTATIMAMFIPDTYEVYWNVSIDKLMDKMEDAHDRFWDNRRKR